MISKIYLFFIVFLINNFLALFSILASDLENPLLSEVFQKPSSVSVINWLGFLEEERNKADILGNFTAFKRLTDEVSATIAGKYGIAERAATEEEALIIIDSITRTRHRFMGQRNMIHDRYLGYDRPKTSSLLQTNLTYQNHMAAVLAIDAMVMKSIADDEFHEMWDQARTTTTTVSHSFISEAINYAKTHEKKEVFSVLHQPLEAFFVSQPATVHLANEDFNIFAPKMTLAKFYSEVIVSGGTYKGWTVHNADALAHPVSLSAEERKSFGERDSLSIEKSLRTLFNEKLSQPYSVSDIFSSTVRAVHPSKGPTQLAIKKDSLLIEYVYDPCVPEQGYTTSGTKLKGDGPKRFYFSRFVEPSLARILSRRCQVIPFSKILDTYKAIYKMLSHTYTPTAMENMLAQSHPVLLNNQAWNLFYGEGGVRQDMIKAIDFMRESANLGCVLAQENLSRFLNNYAVKLFYGKDGIVQDMPEATDLMRESANLGYVLAQENLPILLYEYALKLFNGEKGVKIDLFKALELCKEAANLGNKNADILLTYMLLQSTFY